MPSNTSESRGWAPRAWLVESRSPARVLDSKRVFVVLSATRAAEFVDAIYQRSWTRAELEEKGLVPAPREMFEGASV